MLLCELLEELPGVRYIGDREVAVKKIAYDSRKVEKDTVFVCVKGFETDGHLYIQNALGRGACAVVAQDEVGDLPVPAAIVSDSRAALSMMAARFYGKPLKKMRLIGITGTNGKTTVTYFIKSILETAGHKVGLIGTNQNLIGDTVYPTERTTPESLELQALFAEMADAGVDYAVMEVSSHSLVLNRVFGCIFDCGAFTNLTQDHLDFHHTIEEYLHAKEILFTQSKCGAVNLDDAAGRTIYSHKATDFMTYSIHEPADLMAKDVALHATGVEFMLHQGGEAIKIKLNVPGAFSVYNALCAAAACLCMGISLADIQAGLAKSKGVCGRAEIAYACDKFTVMIDYAHTPDGLSNIIRAVKGFAKGRVVTVFGCGGDRDREKRPLMGEIAARLSDYCIVTSDNPRREDPMRIIADILAGMDEKKGSFRVIENRREAIKAAVTEARQGDVIILAGKGHETYQEINGVKHPFDEREVLREILSQI